MPTTTRPPQPHGTISRRWFAHGYQEALADLQQMFDEGGADRAVEWIQNNLAGAVGWTPAGTPTAEPADPAAPVLLEKDTPVMYAAGDTARPVRATVDSGWLDADAKGGATYCLRTELDGYEGMVYCSASLVTPRPANYVVHFAEAPAGETFAWTFGRIVDFLRVTPHAGDQSEFDVHVRLGNRFAPVTISQDQGPFGENDYAAVTVEARLEDGTVLDQGSYSVDGRS